MASWLTSRLKAAEQFLNQIDATAADRALKKKERAQAGLDSDSEAGELGVGRHFSRTASELSFTDEFTPSGRQSEDETSEAPRFTRHSSLPRPKERQPQKKEAPPVPDWTELLKGGERNGGRNGPKLLKTGGGTVSTPPARAPRFPKQGGQNPTRTMPPTAKHGDEGQQANVLMSAESSTGSATTALENPGEPEVVSKRGGGQVATGEEEPSTPGKEETPQVANMNRPSEDGADGVNVLSGGVNGDSGRQGGTENGSHVETSGRLEILRGILQADGVNALEAEPVRGIPQADGANALEAEPGRGTPQADGVNALDAKPARGVHRSNSGLEAVIPTSDSQEESAIAGGDAGSGEMREGFVKEERATLPEEPVGGNEGSFSKDTRSLEKSDEAADGFEEGVKLDQPDGEATHESAGGGKTSTTGEANPPAMPATISGPSSSQADNVQINSDNKDEVRTGVGSGRRDFSIRDYMGQDLSVKEVETEGVDSDADSESGTDEETDSDSDDSEDERIAEEQRQKEEAERQALERQRAAAAAAALEVTAAETATQAVKEREDVVALLEKEREELQVEAAEASEQHAREIARLRATATAGSEAAHVEKSSHSSTRMETYSKEERLVMENVEKAKALAAAQHALEGVVTGTLEARRKVEERELYRAGLRKQLSEAQQQLRRLQEGSEAEAATSSHEESSLNAELERVEADVRRKKQRVAELEARLAAAATQKREPSDRERELERRLQSLTDHLIQKQAQVEALASEKATLALRLETVSSSLHEDEQGDGPFRKRGKGGRTSGTEWWMDDDLEYGHDEPSSTRAGRSGRGFGFDADDSDDDGKKHKGGIVPGFLVTALQRFDGLTLGGGRFLRVNTPARVLLGLYLLLVHAWVILVWSIQSSNALEEGAAVVGSRLPGAT